LKIYLYRKLFKDLLSSRNKIHWRRKDIDYFLSTKGKIFFECFKPILPKEIDKLAAMIKSRNLKNIKKVIICIYTDIDITVDIFSKIIKCVIISIPINQDKSSVLTGWIEDERKGKSSITVRLIAMCSNHKESISK
jgi:hypothetical protein